MENALEVQEVTHRYKDLVAVDSLSFQVQKGEIFGLLGPNGAGKTTTINLITGLLTPHSGEVWVMGFDPGKDSRQVRQLIGLVPQETNAYVDLSAVDNLWHHAALYCQDLSTVKPRIQDLLTMVNLWERRKDRVRTFSGGMKRRLVLACALLHDPAIVLFDEPTLGVDVQGKHALWRHIKDQQEQGKTFIISTNNMEEADTLCNRLVIIDHGKAIALDTPENLKKALGRDIVTLRTKHQIADPEQLFGGMGVQSISHPEPGLVSFELANAESKVGELVTRITTAHLLESLQLTQPSLDDVFLFHTGRALRD